MRFLADENIPLESIRRLRQAGYDVWAVVEELPGARDRYGNAPFPKGNNEVLLSPGL
ncbi:MAG: DUF5615 family PIN-like protein [Anaerolineae bacterium]|nr:DUF5615 family PIN-like protein [Anaerolineae bacterium]MCX8068311.1 DUF5615 family PIN-like protein [Anaerolineae bacterium]MDW7992667.1 DUF5615 family PIN-like protein [Anaerolineae bacterium]